MQGWVLAAPHHRAAVTTLGMPCPQEHGHTGFQPGSGDSWKAGAIPVLSKRSPLGRGPYQGLLSFPLPSPGLHFSSD